VQEIPASDRRCALDELSEPSQLWLPLWADERRAAYQREANHMDTIIQTMTLAAILLIIGLVCLVLGVSGLMWSARRGRRREEAIEVTRSTDRENDVRHQPANWHG